MYEKRKSKWDWRAYLTADELAILSAADKAKTAGSSGPDIPLALLNREETMTKKPKKPAKTPIKQASVAELERDLARAKRSLGNKKLLPLSAKFYARRQEMILAELARRS